MNKRRTISLDLRERIVTAYDGEKNTREEVARRFRVSLGMVKKLLQQRRQGGDLAARHSRSGRKPQILPEHELRMRVFLNQKPDLTLRELKEAMGLECSLQAIHVVLVRMGLSYKKRRSAPANKIDPTLPRHGAGGGGSKRASIRRG